ncbi:MAG: hypothetical protein K6T90_09425 [Leptolyngbyaceae cyanobacterium HOT.MB2.61]|nr:hypothetical protein [Leptolyngbyaceae cyanobacterium HOT.MB2.61]
MIVYPQRGRQTLKSLATVWEVVLPSSVFSVSIGHRLVHGKNALSGKENRISFLSLQIPQIVLKLPDQFSKYLYFSLNLKNSVW